MSTSAVSPFVTTYATTIPYLTEAEFLAAPTALDITDLIPGGAQAVQDRALADMIFRASGWCDTLANQVLAATKNIERGWYKVNRRGALRIPLNCKPILEVLAVSIGGKPSQLTPLADFSNVVVNRNTIEVPASGGSWGTGRWIGGGVGCEVLVDTTYVNGWPNTLTASATSSGVSVLPVISALGIYPGSSLTISDGVSTESVVLSDAYVAGTEALALASPTLFDHDAGVSISNLPLQVKQACVLLTCALIQTRGDDAIILDSVDNPTRMGEMYGTAGTNVNIASQLLSQVTRVW